MLIQGLCNYYDILSNAGKVLPFGYSRVKVHYLVSLTKEGKIEEIILYQDKEVIQNTKGKTKEKLVPKECIMPKRTEKPGIDANIIEHRPLYLFGLNMEKEILTPIDRTQKAKKSHEEFVLKNLEFIKDIHSPVVDAYRNFLLNWNPEQEVQNENLLSLGKEYGKSGFIFCLSGESDSALLLHNDKKIKEKWSNYIKNNSNNLAGGMTAQCAITGKTEPIARIHNKIKGIYGGLATGSVLISFKNPSENSYGNEQSYNSNISESVMEKYTEALNYLLSGNNHKITVDDTTIVFWAMEESENEEDLVMAMLMGESDKMNADDTEKMLKKILQHGKQGIAEMQKLESLDMIKPEVDFYIVGLKPNSSRISLKFIYRRQYADILWNLARFQQDLQVSENAKPVPFWKVKGELISPKAKKSSINPALLGKIMEAAVYGRNYPEALLETIVRRVKTDVDIPMNAVRAGLIKACLNRNYYLKEELKVALDKENFRQAYLYGRLFAVLERLQKDAAGGKLNRTIKDSYFASASTRPVLVFPKLIRLAQNHLNKSKNSKDFNNWLNEIMQYIDLEFKDILDLKEQGEFMIGYYQQLSEIQRFFDEKWKNKNNKEKKEEN